MRLNRDRVLEAAVVLADEAGLDGFSMRGLAQELGVVPMALYKHVASKDELLDGMVDIVFGEMDSPLAGEDWRSALRRRALSAREALKCHSWAIGLMESRHPGPANLRHHNATMGCLREAGFSFETAIHAYSVQDAYIYGFALQEKTLGLDTPEKAGEAAQRRAETIGSLDDYPYLVEVVTRLPETGYDTDIEFAWGLDLILDGLDQLRREA
ncbi:MAG: TetR/AcrR family transcriptional regulator C-terminal domain-containing protein [Solirubrobacterales bacterium]|nr:TetR/AcrR family transcriptional regulator C-terminal domain-containing protein [Solirubrobacterales bacterium]